MKEVLLFDFAKQMKRMEESPVETVNCEVLHIDIVEI